jgi:hypothetical protein
MRKGEKRSRRRSQRLVAKGAASRAVARSERAAPRLLFQLSPRHLLVLKELDRLFPELAPIVDFHDLDPGVESVESVARLLLDLLIRHFDRPVFLAFGEINSERLIDRIEQQIVAGALPLSAHEVFAETMFRLFQRLQERDRFGRLLPLPATPRRRREELELDPHDRSRTVFDLLAMSALRIVDEQIRWLRASTIPLPGIPAACVKPPSSIVSDGSRLLGSSIHLSDREAECWVAHALMQLPDETRRLIYLRRHQGLDAAAIGALLGLKPFEVLLRLRRAELDFREQIRATLLRFVGREGGSNEAASSGPEEREGRVVQWPHESPKSPKSGDDSHTAGVLKEPSSPRGRRPPATPPSKSFRSTPKPPSRRPSHEKEDEGDTDD